MKQAIMLSGWGMNPDNRAKTAGAFNLLWDDGEQSVIGAMTGRFQLTTGGCLSIGLSNRTRLLRQFKTRFYPISDFGRAFYALGRHRASHEPQGHSDPTKMHGSRRSGLNIPGFFPTGSTAIVPTCPFSSLTRKHANSFASFSRRWNKPQKVRADTWNRLDHSRLELLNSFSVSPGCSRFFREKKKFPSNRRPARPNWRSIR